MIMLLLLPFVSSLDGRVYSVNVPCPFFFATSLRFIPLRCSQNRCQFCIFDLIFFFAPCIFKSQCKEQSSVHCPSNVIQVVRATYRRIAISGKKTVYSMVCGMKVKFKNGNIADGLVFIWYFVFCICFSFLFVRILVTSNRFLSPLSLFDATNKKNLKL